jgi:hypothetical protein
VEFISDSPAFQFADVYAYYVDVHWFSKTGRILVSIGLSMANNKYIFSIILVVGAGADSEFCVASAYVRGFEGADVEGVGAGS